MNNLVKRVGVLEAATPTDRGVCHRILRHPGMSQDDAIDEYGRHRIQPNDRIIMRTIIPAPTVEIIS